MATRATKSDPLEPLIEFFGHRAALDPHTRRPCERVFTAQRLAALLADRPVGRRSVGGIIQLLVKERWLSRYSFEFGDRVSDVYAWGTASLVEVLLAARPQAYLSHRSAAWTFDAPAAVRAANGLWNWYPVEPLPVNVYLSHTTQRVRQKQYPPLTQEGIDDAFSRPKPRVEKTISVAGHSIYLLHANSAAGLEEADVRVGDSANVPVRRTSLERTLIDIAVRPEYVGGVANVLSVYRRLWSEVDLSGLLALLKDLRYPYHQVVGFYLEKSGLGGRGVERFRKLPMPFDFYLAHGMSDTTYVPEWRLHVPDDL